MIRADQVHERADWPSLLTRLGVGETYLRNRAGPCPSCGGRDRYRFDNRFRRGDFFCRKCGAGDGFTLLERIHGWTFKEAMDEIALVLGLTETPYQHATQRAVAPPSEPELAKPTARVRDLMRSSAPLHLVADAERYLESRRLWPLRCETDLRGASLADYWNGRDKLGSFPALLAPVKDRDGELVTVHVTYLSNGAKLDLDGHPSRKILSKMTGRDGCSVRLGPPGSSLGIAEGIETALAAAVLHDETVWSALNAPMLAKWTPPESVGHVTVYADRDDAGLEAAEVLSDRLQADGLTVSLRIPRGAAGDWADVLEQSAQ